MSRVFTLVAVGVGFAGSATQYLRWLRVAQREHYIAGSVFQFWRRWSLTGTNLFITLAGAVATVLGLVASPRIGVVVFGAFATVTPRGLTMRGRTSALAWTRRLKTLAGVAVALQVCVMGIALAFGISRPGLGWTIAVVSLASVPLLIDAAAWLTTPVERRLSQKFVDRAERRLRKVNPRVVAVTGSYGKTSTKHHIAELMGASSGVVPTPRSFNNRAGLSRAINENLVDGTRVFIAEMGTYGTGEIADLCAWCPPDIAVVTAIGPVHLERMKTLDTIESAKFEITERAGIVIVNADDPRLSRWVEPLRAAGKRVITAGTTADCDVAVCSDNERWQIMRDGQQVAEVLPVSGVRPSNVACAIAVAFELGLEVYDVATRIGHLTPPQHRLTVVRAPSGLTIIDDTFNANPASAQVALEALRDVPIGGRRVVVTPGLVELGAQQVVENRKLGSSIQIADLELVVVASTNARALQDGFGGTTIRCATREEAVTWVRENLTAEDAVLYLNDLPDHYP